MRVTIGRLDLDDALADLKNGDIEGSASEVEDGDLFVLLLVEAVGESGGCGLVDETHHLEPRDLSRVFRRLALRVVEVSRHGDDSLLHLLPEIVLRRLF